MDFWAGILRKRIEQVVVENDLPGATWQGVEDLHLLRVVEDLELWRPREALRTKHRLVEALPLELALRATAARGASTPTRKKSRLRQTSRVTQSQGA